MSKKYICVQGSPEIPKGTMVIFAPGMNTTWCAPNNVAWIKCPLELWQVKGNECWEELEVTERWYVTKDDSLGRTGDVVGTFDTERQARDFVLSNTKDDDCYVRSEYTIHKNTSWKKEKSELKEEKAKEEEAAPTRWKPKTEGEYHYLDSEGYIRTAEYNCAVDERRYIMGNCFKTEEEARDEVIRRESIAHAWVPEKGEEYWVWDFYHTTPRRRSTLYSAFLAEQYIGAVHPTEEACEIWGKKYARLFVK